MWGFRRMLVRRNLISQYHNITISQFSLCVLRRIFSILYPLMFRILGYSVSSGIRYPQALSGIITNITIFARCPQANFIVGILWYLVSSGIWYPLVFGIRWYSVSSGFSGNITNITVISQCYHYIVRCPQTIFLSFGILGVSS